MKKNVIIITGNQYEVEKNFTEMLDAFKPNSIARYNFSDPDMDLDKLCTDIVRTDIFRPRRAIVVKGQPKETKKLMHFINKATKNNLIIFGDYSHFGRQKEFVKYVKDIGLVLEFDQEIKDLRGFVSEMLEGNDIEFEEGVPEMIVQIVGGDVGVISSEIPKFKSYLNDGEKLNQEHVRALCASGGEFVIWDFLSNIGQRNIHESIKRLNEASMNDVNHEHTLGMLIRYFRLALMSKEMNKDGVKSDDIREVISRIKKEDGKVMYSPYEVNNMLNNRDSIYNKYKYNELCYAYKSILNTFFNMRRYSFGPKEKEKAMTYLIFAICLPRSKKIGLKYSIDFITQIDCI